MFSEIVCREWNSIRVRFWSIGYKKRLSLLILLLLLLGCFLVWSSLMVDLSDLKFTQEKDDGVNDSSVWDKWVIANGLRAIGDIYDSCGEFFFRQNFLVKISFSVNKCCLEKIDETLWIAPIENRNSHAQKLVK